MPNLRVIWDNAADRASTLTASTTAGALVASNMQTDIKGQVHRSTGTSVSYTLTWPGGETVGALGLPATNLTADATARMRLYSDTACTALLADSGTQYACPGNTLELWDWSEPLNANAFAYGGASKTGLWLASHYFAKGCIIDLADPGNPAGYIDCARLVVGRYRSPVWNASYGAEVDMPDTSVNVRNQAGDNQSDLGIRFDRMTLDLKLMPEADRAWLMSIIRSAGVSRNIFLSLLPNDAVPVAEQDHMIYGKRANRPLRFEAYQAYSNQVELEGW